MEASTSCDLLNFLKFCFTSNTISQKIQFEHTQMIREKHRAEVQQMVQLVNNFLHQHRQSALVHASQKHIPSYRSNMNWNLLFKILLPLAPSTHQVYPALFTDCMTGASDPRSKRSRPHSPPVYLQ